MKVKAKTIIPLVVMIITIAFSVIKKNIEKSNISFRKPPTTQSTKEKVEHSNTKPDGEMRATWITFMTLDMKNSDMSKKSFEEKFKNIALESKKFGLNTLIVHVRPYADSLYPSSIFPWSHLLTGQQGKDPKYDPLKFMIEECHKLGLKFHAWINPLRIQINGVPSELASDNVYNQKDSLPKNFVMEDQKGKYLNPAINEVREKIIDGIKEIVENYQVDGIHFDDYFYPLDSQELDDESYNQYKEESQKNGVPMSKDEWRRSNINSLICGTYSAIKNISPEVQFGISPQGNVKNDLSMGADVSYWGSITGFVDYLCPQIYVSFDHPVLPFDSTAKQWRDIVKCSSIDLYYGLGVYKASTDADQGTWQGSNDILKREIEFGRSLGANGFALYAWDNIVQKENDDEVINVMKMLN